ncbi:SDR family oxidoreductase [Streptomyces sp. NPDC058914]|uniref:SDR family oxidoreductase n=1 Tax=Streptomyces sp. NPDC058914 TaxID=3346671 RepID=UPI00368F764C
MLDADGSSIVNVASIAVLHAVADRAAYNAGQHGLTRGLAAEWGDREVRANAVCPGWVSLRRAPAEQASGGHTDSDIVERVPMAWFAAPEDIAQAMAFLADHVRSCFVSRAAGGRSLNSLRCDPYRSDDCGVGGDPATATK